MLILAINRVQAVCQAPLACRKTVASMMTPEALLAFYLAKKQLDIERYKALHFNSSHVGDLYLLPVTERKNESGSGESELGIGVRVKAGCGEAKPALSVLIPVHTGPSDAAVHAIRSIVMQPVEEYRGIMHQYEELPGPPPHDTHPLTLSSMQIVIVDDRCVDGSINAMIEAIKEVASEYSFVKVNSKDCRLDPSRADDIILVDSSIGNKHVVLSIEIVSSPTPGVAAALNHGLSHCKSDYVARMDADDIAAPGRLREQIAALQYRSDVDVVGTNIVLFREAAIGLGESRLDIDEPPIKNLSPLPSIALPYSSALPTDGNDSMIDVITSMPPTDAGFAAWAMLFSCSIAHPSIVYRRKAVVEAGRYDETFSFAEDYNLWLRMTMHKCSSLVSIPRIGLWHRKHRSRPLHASKQADEALRASIDSMNVLLKRLSDSEWNQSRLASAANILRKPDTASSLHQLNESSDLLIALEAAFLCSHGDVLTSREKGLIAKDCDERIGELATLAVESSLVAPSEMKDSSAWRVWCERCPELTMNRIAMLCHTYRGN
jgi:glycosyltransferase involved in cell wall biosynthesis